MVKPIIGTKYQLGLGKKNSWKETLADELHKHIKRKFPRRSVIVFSKAKKKTICVFQVSRPYLGPDPKHFIVLKKLYIK